jgi:hypothetical protein
LEGFLALYLFSVERYLEAIAMSNNGVGIASLEQMRDKYRAVKIVLLKNESPEDTDEIHYAEGATFDRAIQNLWIDLCDRTPGRGMAVFQKYCDWFILDAESFLMERRLGRFEDFLDFPVPSLERNIRGYPHPPRNLGLVLSYVEKAMLLGFFLSTLSAATFIYVLRPDLNNSGSSLVAVLSVGCLGAGVNRAIAKSHLRGGDRND